MNAVNSCGAGSRCTAPAAASRQFSRWVGCAGSRAMLFVLLLSLAAPAPAFAAQPPAPRAWSCSGVYHVVQRGESIYSIARRFGTTAYRIAVCNGLASYTVFVGQSLLVPTTARRAA